MNPTFLKPLAFAQTSTSYAKPLACIMVAMLMNACATQNTNNNNNTGYAMPSMQRTISERISDEFIERTSHKNLSNINGVGENNVRIAINSFRREVLLTGEVPSESIKMEVANMVSSINDVKKVYNNLTVTVTPKAQSHTLHENYLKSRIIAKIVSAGGVKSSQYKLVVRDNMAYLLGFLTGEQEQTIVNAIASVQGMEGVKVLSTRVGGDMSGFAITTNDIDEDPNAGGMVYGGGTSPVYPTAAVPTTTYPQSMYPNAVSTSYDASSMGSYTHTTPTYPNTPTNSATGYNPNAPVVKMEGSPTSSYVNLYNNTSKP